MIASIGGRRRGTVQVAENVRTRGVDELDPYVKCTLLPYSVKKQCAPVMDAGHNPVWTEKHKNVLRLTITKNMSQSFGAGVEPHLKLQTYDEDIGRDDFLGQAILPLWCLLDPERYEQKQKLMQKKRRREKERNLMMEAKKERRKFVEETTKGKPAFHGCAEAAAMANGRRMSAPDAMRLLPDGGAAGSAAAVAAAAAAAAAGSESSTAKESEAAQAEQVIQASLVPGSVTDAELESVLESATSSEPPTKKPESEAEEAAAVRTTEEKQEKKSKNEIDDDEDVSVEGLPPMHSLSNGSIKRIPMTDSQGRTSDSNHDSFGWIEVRLTWEPSSGALLSDSMASVASLATTMLSVKRKAGVAPPATIAEDSASTDTADAAPPSSAGAGAAAAAAASLVPRPPGGPKRTSGRRIASALTSAMESLDGSEVDREIGLHEQPYGVLVVEVVRGSGLQLQKEEQHIAATNDTSLFIAAVVMVLGYLGLGVLWYVLMEEHCTTPVEGRPALCGGLGVDCSAGLTEATCDAITGCHYAAAIESVLHSCSSWTAVDALYFTVVTFTTIGYGDFTPTRPISKVFTALFALTGVALIGGALGIVAGYIIEKLNIEMKARLREAKEAEVLTGVNRHNTTDVDYQTTNQLGINRVRAEGRAAIDNGLQLAVVIGIGVALFYGFGPDGMTGSDLVYAAVITACSIGYGDFSFATQTGRGLCTLYAVLAVIVTSRFVAGISAYIVNSKQEALVQKALRRRLRVSDLLEMDTDGDGCVEKLEFLQKMLVRLGKCETVDIDEIIGQFEQLDEDGSGTLTREDIELAVRKQHREAEEDAMDRAGRRTTDGGGDEDEGPHGEP